MKARNQISIFKRRFNLLDLLQCILFLLFIVFLIFNIFTKLNSPGLMDDATLIQKYPNLYDNFIQFQVEGWGGFFILAYVTNFINISILNFFGSNFYFLFNFLYIFFEIFIIYKVFSKFIKIDPGIFLIVFLVYPYFTDYFFFPSLQVKYIFLIFTFLVFLLQYSINKKYFLSFILGLLIPLIKLEASPLIVILLLIYFDSRFNKRRTLFALVGMTISNIMAIYVFINFRGSYTLEIKNNISNSLIKNIVYNFVNSYDLIFIFISLLFASYFVFKRKDLLLIGLIAYDFIVILLITTFRISNYYLSGILIYSVAILFAYIFKNYKLIPNQKAIFTILLPFLIIFSTTFLFEPRFDRWYGIANIKNVLLEVPSDKDVYHSCSEAAESLSFFNSRPIKYEDFERLRYLNDSYYFIYDSFNCGLVQNQILNTCKYSVLSSNKSTEFKVLKISSCS